MRVVECTSSRDGIAASAFRSARGELVVHITNATQTETPIALGITGTSAPLARHRTSATEDAAPLPALTATGNSYPDVLPPASLTTYRAQLK
jgi:hypothetical protein